MLASPFRQRLRARRRRQFLAPRSAGALHLRTTTGQHGLRFKLGSRFLFGHSGLLRSSCFSDALRRPPFAAVPGCRPGSTSPCLSREQRPHRRWRSASSFRPAEKPPAPGPGGARPPGTTCRAGVVEIAALPHQPADRRHLRLRDPPAAPGRPGTPSVRLGHDCHLLSQAVENSTALTPKCESVHVAVSYLLMNAFPVSPSRFLCSVSDHVFRLTVSARIASSQSPACRTPPGR